MDISAWTSFPRALSLSANRDERAELQSELGGQYGKYETSAVAIN